jgi:hypothetical protein
MTVQKDDLSFVVKRAGLLLSNWIPEAGKDKMLNWFSPEIVIKYRFTFPFAEKILSYTL